MVLVFLAGLLWPWSPMWRTEEDMNLVSGRVRSVRRVCFLPVLSKITDTPVSLELRVADGADAWVPVNHFGIWPSHSPHFLHHSAIFNAHTLGRAYADGHWDNRARRLAATQFLKLLRETGDTREAAAFTMTLWCRSLENPELVDEVCIQKIITEVRRQSGAML